MFGGEKTGGDCAGIERDAAAKPLHHASEGEVISIRSGMGLGDSLYLQSVARHLVRKGHRIEACSAWPDVFRPLGDRARVVPFRRDRIDRLAHYSLRKREKTDQFQDCCLQAGIREPVELRLDWTVRNAALAEQILSLRGPVILVQLPRSPMGRTDGYGAELLPDCRSIQVAIDTLKGFASFVQVGSGEPLFRFRGIDLDLVNKTTVCDLLDVAAVASGVLGYVSFAVPLSESLGKPALFVWSRKGLRSRTEYIRTITPHKIFHRESSRFVMDDADRSNIEKAAHALFEQAAGS